MKKRLIFTFIVLVSALSFAQTDNEIQGDNAGTAITTGSNNAIFGG